MTRENTSHYTTDTDPRMTWRTDDVTFTVGQDDQAGITIFRPGQIEVDWSKDTAVDPTYVREVVDTVKGMPKDAMDLERMVLGLSGSNEDRERIHEQYVGHWGDTQLKTLDGRFISRNPFQHTYPRGLGKFESWLKETGKEWEYKTRSFGKREIVDANIQVMRKWNEYYAIFIDSLNIPDRDTRFEAIKEANKKIFGEPVGFLRAKTLQELSPQETPVQWHAFQTLNILLSPEERITWLARFRALETLQIHGKDQVLDAILGIPKTGSSGNRSSADTWFKIEFDKKHRRLPRSMWTSEERRKDIHESWESNPHIQKIFRTSGIPYHDQKLDYAEIANTLVVSHPREALQILMLMEWGSYRVDRQVVLSSILDLTRLDPVTRFKVFGPDASYVSMHKTPMGDEQRVEEALGLAVFDRDTAIDFKGLSKDEMLQVIRLYQKRIEDMEVQLQESEARRTTDYFKRIKPNEIKKVDPKGYWQLLGVHPDADRQVIDDFLKRSYRVLVQRHHPDTAKNASERKEKEAKMKEINEAYATLADPEKRRLYSRT